MQPFECYLSAQWVDCWNQKNIRLERNTWKYFELNSLSPQRRHLNPRMIHFIVSKGCCNQTKSIQRMLQPNQWYPVSKGYWKHSWAHCGKNVWTWNQDCSFNCAGPARLLDQIAQKKHTSPSTQIGLNNFSIFFWGTHGPPCETLRRHLMNKGPLSAGQVLAEWVLMDVWVERVVWLWGSRMGGVRSILYLFLAMHRRIPGIWKIRGPSSHGYI